MARPCKPASMLSKCSQTKDEIAQRERIEKKLRGNGKLPKPPEDLNPEQKRIFKKVVNQLKDSEILCEKDTPILRQYATAIERIRYIDGMINENPEELTNSKLISARKQYMSDFFRCCNELGCSPQSRSKYGNNAAEKEADPLAEIVKACGEDEQS